MERVAIPIWDGRISPVLDAATKLQVSILSEGDIESSRLVEIGNMQDHDLARLLNEMDIDTIICGAVSEGLRGRCSRYGITVVHSQTGGIREALDRYICSPQRAHHPRTQDGGLESRR